MTSEFSSSKSSADSESGASSASTTADTKSVDSPVVVSGSAASATVQASSPRKFGLHGWDEARFQCSVAGTGWNNEIGAGTSLIDRRSVNFCPVSCVLRLVLINFSWLKPHSTSALEEFAASLEHWWCFRDLYVILEPPMSNCPALCLLSPAMGGQLSNLG